MEKCGKIDGETELISAEEDEQTLNRDHDSFVWDQNSQLYYHPRSGFYHDPNAGWYYSTSDGLYYKFGDGNYILLESHKDFPSMTNGQSNSASDEAREHATCAIDYDHEKQENQDHIDCGSNEVREHNPPPSEWLEDTLIELYLSGYPAAASDAAEPLFPYEQDDDINDSMLSTDASNSETVQRDGELSCDHQTPTTSVAREDQSQTETSWEEENWRAQYGQVVQHEDELRPKCDAVDIWDWSMDRDIQKDGNYHMARLIGKLVKPSSNLHPSITSHGRRFKTALIIRAHLDLVHVRSGQVYKLRIPNAGYLSTLSSYDASNPTKDWGFPELSNEDTKGKRDTKTSSHVSSKQNDNSCLDEPSTSKKHKSHEYRDRAAERRSFHKEFGATLGEESSDELHESESIEEAAAEALEMSLGTASYAQKILKNMGWKEGDGLGKTHQGLREPLKGTGNKGTAGLGWPSGRLV
ncbi:hypothetical protein RND81_13G133800 [Saponaria officinalis]|uniref:G-patch domain-containing protein n=1 Tax=Saponaria officinalis TaxID=3572 RepID=A0AAW1H0K9_SAPOF